MFDQINAIAFSLADIGASDATLAEQTEPIGLDKPAKVAFVSHAHADHARAAKSKNTEYVVSTKATFDLMHVLGLSKLRKKEFALEYNSFSGEEVRITLLNAGHVLGSAQFIAELQNGFSFAYTGDFKLEDALTTKGAGIAECDVLAIDATFGSREFEFPSREEVYDEIACWTAGEQEKGSIVVLGGYSLGKAQELVACLNDRLGIAPVVSEKIARVCRVYDKHGVKLDFLSVESEEAQSVLRDAFVAVLPTSKVTPELASSLSEAYGRRVKTSIASGWAAKYRFVGVNKAFCLSDHADFEQLMAYVEASGASTVLCQGAHKREFAREVNEKGLAKAVPATI